MRGVYSYFTELENMNSKICLRKNMNSIHVHIKLMLYISDGSSNFFFNNNLVIFFLNVNKHKNKQKHL